MPERSKVLVTGGTGFIGHALLRRLAARDDLDVYAWVRRPQPCLVPRVRQLLVGAGSGALLEPGTELVVHCAGRAHVMAEKARDPLAEFRRTNVELTLELARQAAEAGAKRLVFLSSVKVNGEVTKLGEAFRETDAPAPADPYAVSKLEAEQGLQALAARTGLEVVIIRTPLVYGPGAKANFRALMRWISLGVPLPFGAVQNRRSLVALDNLIDLLEVCMEHPAAANELFLVADGVDVSTTELLRRLSVALQVPSRLLPMPQSTLAAMARLTNRGGLYVRLCGSLQVDAGKARRVLGWTPQATMSQVLARTAEEFLGRSRQ